MKKVVCMLFLFALLLSACKGNPPVQGTQSEETTSSEEITSSAGTTSSEAGTKPGSTEPESTEPVTVSNTEGDNDLVALCKQLSEGMAGGDFATVVGYFGGELKQGLNEASLKQSWEATVLMLGNYIGVYDAEQTVSEENAAVTVLLEYQNNGLAVYFTFDKDRKIIGLFINYQEIVKENGEHKDFEEISMQVGEYQLDGILTIPKNVEKPPVVIMVQGSGSSDMDETIGAVSNKPFRDIAQGLASQGIASLRYNKRYKQRPDAYKATDTIEDEVLEDVYEAISLVMSREDVDTGALYLLGHSLGGMLAPQIAAARPDVKGLIILAGSPRQLYEISYDQNIDAAKNMNMSKEELEEGMKQFEGIIDSIKSINEPSGINYLGISDYYWKSLNDIDTKKLASELTIPFLILQGSADFQVKPETDFDLWKEVLAEKANVSFELYEGLNHLFMKSNGKLDLTEYDIKGTVDQGVILRIADWVKGQ